MYKEKIYKMVNLRICIRYRRLKKTIAHIKLIIFRSKIKCIPSYKNILHKHIIRLVT